MAAGFAVIVAAMQETSFKTADGWELPATLFTSPAGKGPAVLISAAAGVPRRFYRHYAQFLCDEGARAVMTWDYRGMTGEISRSTARSLRMSDWAVKDFPAAVGFLGERFPDSSLRGIGHSFGGQALGLSGEANRFARYMTIAAGSGYLGHTREFARLSRAMNWAGWPLAAFFGYLPRWVGFGEPMPYGAFNQWRKWCNDPQYLMGDASIPERSRFKDVRIPMLAVGFEDDPWATRKSVEALVAWYSNAAIRIHWYGEDDLQRPVGHLGFFRPDHRDTLWPQLADWLLQP
ncbi:MAG: alpha/beta hydrolase [Nitratireductor sp.]|nr:alpha/beta hydrolase [Nitratireductor sp.]